MARRKPDPILQKVRHLARNGRRQEAAEILEQLVQTEPKHTKARKELARYLTGKPFSFEELDYLELQNIISDFLRAPQKLGQMKIKALKKLKHRSYYLEHALEHLLSPSEKRNLSQLRDAIAREQVRRRRPLSKLTIGGAATLATIVVLGSAIYFLWQRAEKAADIMSGITAEKFQRKQAAQVLQVHDTGLNRTLNRRVGEQAERLHMLIRVSEQHSREVDAILREIESGRKSIVDQGVRRRILIERRLKELGQDAGQLLVRWQALCRKEEMALNQQRLSLVEELMAPLPEWLGLTGKPEEDIQQLRNRMKTLQQRVLIYEEAAEVLKLPESTISTIRQEMEAHHKVIAEITACDNMLKLLPDVRHYDRYQKILRSFKPEHYMPAVELMRIATMLPSTASVRDMMQEYGQNLPPGLLQAAKESLVDGKPSFSASFPATAEQLHLLDELLTNSALHTRLYELTNTVDNLYAYSEELPELKRGRACFKRSALDPESDVIKDKFIEWQNPRSVVSRTLDPRPLYKELAMDNKSGYSSVVNLPDVMTRLLQHSHPDVPVLAKAYIFHHLIQINNLSQHQILSGLRFAPEMRRTVESFEKLRQECDIKLNGSCWLRRTPLHAEAERKFLRWFNKHRKVDFVAELRRNLRVLLGVTPQFCGYINEKGDAALFAPPHEGQIIWYLSDSVMTTTAWGETLQSPMLLSPVFIMEKMY